MNIIIPEKLNLAYLPTPIYKMTRLSEMLGKNIYIKRDDLTGPEYSGNKIRKLEYSAAEALRLGATVLISCGGIQSNHCRAVAAVAAKLGLKSHLVLRISEKPSVEGNYFLDLLLGSEISFVNAEQYSNERGEIMRKIADDYTQHGEKAYIIPEGASNGIGNFGYADAMREICEQEKSLGFGFGAVVCAVGSGGTYSGLYFGRKLLGINKRIIGFCVCDTPEYFKDKIVGIVSETSEIAGSDIIPDKSDMEIIGGYVGAGYAISSPDELEFIKIIARMEGIILDPVYTGKALFGLYSEINAGRLRDLDNILFIHTGGVFGLFPKQGQFVW